MKRYAYAQSLDNISTDIILEEENFIEGDSLKRKYVANQIFTVSNKGKMIFSDENGIRIYKLREKIVANLPTEELDLAGRKSSITFLFEIDTRDDKIEKIREKLSDYIEKAMKLCNRKTNQYLVNDFMKKLEETISEKTSEIHKLLKIAAIVGISLLAIYLIFGLRR